MGSSFLAFYRLVAAVLVLLILAPVQALLCLVPLPLSKYFVIIVHRTMCRVLGVNIYIKGKPAKKGPVFYISNHTSYIDIFALGSMIKGSFIAKSEISGWPVLGYLARLQQTIFIKRDRRHLQQQKQVIKDRFNEGDDLILFPEGTTNDGNRVLPFKSSLFSVVEGVDAFVQPVSISYVNLDGWPLGRRLRPFFAWYADMALGPHLWRMAGLGKLDVYIEFHEPVKASEIGSRKEITQYCFERVEDGVMSVLYGPRTEYSDDLPDPIEQDVKEYQKEFKHLVGKRARDVIRRSFRKKKPA